MRHITNLFIFLAKCIGWPLFILGLIGTCIEIAEFIGKRASVGEVIFAISITLIGWVITRAKYVEAPRPQKAAKETQCIPPQRAWEPELPPALPAAHSTTHITINIPANGQTVQQQIQLTRCGYCGGMSPEGSAYCQQCRAPF